jgi:CDP-diacylglycerol pyrophosphatase
LLHIVETCAVPPSGDYCERCRYPQPGACPGIVACRATTEVRAENAEFVAIRDRKMCGCPAGFLHLLVVPRAPVTGVEDPRRPDAIWPFAWAVATAHLAPQDAALAVNQRADRGQDQLHVHVVRLAAGARDRIAARRPSVTASLDDVWEVAARDAGARGLGSYGVLVARVAEGRFAVLTTPESPEDAFTEGRCR